MDFFWLEFCNIFMKLLSSTFLESMPKDQFRCRKNIILSVKCVINDSRPSISYFMLTWFPILYSYQMPLKSFADYNLFSLSYTFYINSILKKKKSLMCCKLLRNHVERINLYVLSFWNLPFFVECKYFN